uniref:Uncharacterized protein n=1 Tax=Glossina pallidipes TaxID=7398 RepID=A0A1B0A9K4_GLOPL
MKTKLQKNIWNKKIDVYWLPNLKCAKPPQPPMLFLFARVRTCAAHTTVERTHNSVNRMVTCLVFYVFVTSLWAENSPKLALNQFVGSILLVLIYGAINAYF